MASKRKREDSEDIPSTPNAKISKQEEVTRSGRVRKKPAKFADDVGDDLNIDATKTEPTKVVVTPPKPKTVPVQAAPPLPPVQPPVPPTPPVTKIVTIKEPVIHEEDLISMDKRVEEEAQSAARRGRARKKSAKVLEMEEFEEAEKKQVNKKDTSKKQKTPTSPLPGMKGLPKSPTSPVPTTVAKLLTSPTSNLKIKDIQPTMKIGSFSPTNVPTSPVKATSLGSSPKSPGSTVRLASPTGGKGSVIKLLLSSPAQSSNPLLTSATVSQAPAAPEKSTKKKRAKEKSSPADDHLKLKQALEMPKQTSLSPIKQELNVAPVKVKSEVGEKLGIKLKMSQLQKGGDMIQVTSTGITPKATGKEAKSKKGKKSSMKDESVFLSPPLPTPNVIHVGSGNLGLEIKTEPDSVPKKKSKGKAEIEKQKAKDKLDMEESMMDHEFGLDMGDMNLAEPGEDSFMDIEDEDSLIIPEEEIDVKPKSAKKKKVVKSKAANKMGQVDFSDMPSDSDLVMDFSRMKSEDRKKKKAAAKEASEDAEKNASKKKRAPTAYMLWCNETRPKVVMENPGIDFSSISKTLGEMWSSLPEKEKLVWKRKAKKAAGKGSTLITTGKAGGQKTATTAQATLITAAKQGTVVTQKPSLTAAAAAAVLSAKQAKQTVDDISMPVKGFGIEPVDVAAHLKIVGESLSIIGMRLQEHRGLIAVQGSLSVLLDSMLCAVAPLMCLTAILPETNGLPHNTHMKNLDNIAYVMPGL